MTKVTVSDVKKARVIIDLDGDLYTLVPSPDAILSLSAKYDGLAPLIGSIARINVQAMADVIVAGAGLKGSDARDIAGRVAMSPMIDSLMGKVSDFAAILANGGRPLRTEQAEEGDTRPL